MNAGQARRIVGDLFEHDRAAYYRDLLGSAAAGWALFAWSLKYPWLSPENSALLLAGSLLLFRALVMNHPIFHLPEGSWRRRMRAFYNAVVGVPFLVPFFTYQAGHAAHHRHTLYGTPADPEYLPFASRSPLLLVGLPLATAFSPLALYLRFALIGPLSFIHPRLRRWVEARASSLSLRTGYTRPSGSLSDPSWLGEEIACIGAAVGGTLAVAFGYLPLQLALQWYEVGVVVALLNVMQIFVLHRYGSQDVESGAAEQLLDSNNVPGRLPWITALWAPVGQRFHALHHLLPTLPYHCMPEAHRRLMRDLPEDSAYTRTLASGYWDAYFRLFRAARSGRRQH